jgi:hypothetical protein
LSLRRSWIDIHSVLASRPRRKVAAHVGADQNFPKWDDFSPI